MPADGVDSSVGRSFSGPPGARTPVRSCIGCRGRAAKPDLLRVVVVESEAGPSVEADPAARRPGRGAYLHLDRACFEQAVRRRAFPRALRVAGPLRTDALAAYVDRRVGDGHGSTG